MATIFNTGFEMGAMIELDSNNGTASIQSTTVRTGTYALRVNPTTTAVGSVTLAGIAAGGASTGYSAATTYIRFYFRYATKPSSGDEEIYRTRAGAALKFQLRLNSSGNLVAYQQDLTSLGTGSTALSADTWYRIEVRVGTAVAGSGVWEVKLDGTSELSGSTADLLNSNNTRCELGKDVNYNGNTVDFYYDDAIISNSAFPGAGECKVLYADANGNYQTWSIGAGSGNHYEVVDEVPHDSDTSYLLSSNVVGEAETEALISAETAGISGTVNTVRAVCMFKRDGASNGSVRVRLRSGSTDSTNGTNSSVAASYSDFSRILDTDPATSSAWTVSALNSIEVGAVEQQASTLMTRMTAAYAMVDYAPSAAEPTVMTPIPTFLLMGVGQ